MNSEPSNSTKGVEGAHSQAARANPKRPRNPYGLDSRSPTPESSSTASLEQKIAKAVTKDLTNHNQSEARTFTVSKRETRDANDAHKPNQVQYLLTSTDTDHFNAQIVDINEKLGKCLADNQRLSRIVADLQTRLDDLDTDELQRDLPTQAARTGTAGRSQTSKNPKSTNPSHKRKRVG